MRRYKRFTVDLMGIHGTVLYGTEVEIIDLSHGGISIKTDRRLGIGNIYSLKIRDGERVLTTRGKVVWSLMKRTGKKSLDENNAIYRAGIKFIEMTDEIATELVEFIEKNRLDSDQNKDVHGLSGLRDKIRFAMNTKKRAILDFPEHYKIKKLSRGGMLIESDHALEMENEFPMEISLPGENLIGFLGRIAMCLPTHRENEEHYDIGIEFFDMPKTEKERLEKFLSTLSEEDMPSPEP